MSEREQLVSKVCGAVLIGGQSRRMGRPKQLIVHRGKTLSERAVAALDPHTAEIVIAGENEVPEAIRHLPRIADPPGLRGPMAGILAALTRSRDAAWVVVACDMPNVRTEAVAWLLSNRRPGVCAILPRPGGGRPVPTFAVYEPQARRLLVDLVKNGRWGPRHLAHDPRVVCPVPPPEHADAWINVNNPEEIDRASGSDV